MSGPRPRGGDVFGRPGPTDHELVAKPLREARGWLASFETTGNPSDLDNSVNAGVLAMRMCAPHAPERIAVLMVLAEARILRHELTKSMGELERALRHHHELLGLVRTGQPDLVPAVLTAVAGFSLRLGAFTSNLSLVEDSVLATRELHLLAQSTGATHICPTVVEMLEKALVVLPADHADRAAIGAMRCTAMIQHIEATGDASQLGEAQEEIERALRLCPPGDANRRPFLAVLADVRRLRHDLERSRTSLEAFLDVERQVVDAYPAGHVVWAATVHNIGLLHRDRYKHTQDVADLDTAAHYLRQAIKHAKDNERRTAAERGLAEVLKTRGPVPKPDLPPGLEFVAGTEPPQRPLAEVGTDTGELVRHGNRLSGLLQQYEHTGEPELLARICADAEALLAALPADHSDRWVIETKLGPALMRRYEIAGDPADLDTAIDMQRKAIARPVLSPSSIDEELGNLAAALVNRFLRDRDSADLDEAITLARRGTEQDDAPGGHHLFVLGTALVYRYRHLGRRYDLDEAIEVGNRALGEASQLHIGHAHANLGNRLRERYLAGDDPADLDAAIEHLTASLERDDDVSARLNLALALHNRGALRDDQQDLLDSVTAFNAILAATHEQAPIRMTAQRGLGQVLTKLGRLEDAIATLTEAVAAGTGRSFDRMEALVTLAGLRADHDASWRDVADIYAEAVRQLHLLVWRGLDATDRNKLVSQWSGLACDAAAAALAADQPERAVELLEHGRSLWWGQVLDRRTDLTELRTEHPDLADRLSSVDLDTGMDKRAAATEWEAIVAAIRDQPGFEHFLEPTPFAELTESAVDGPIVLVNVSRHRCDAIVLAPDRGYVVPLPRLTFDDARDRTRAYLDATAKVGTGGWSSGPREQMLLDYLEWLWDTVAQPVLDEIALPVGARLWWCPAGPLALAPLHAAGYHDPDDPPGRTVLDRVVSSNTPTIRALRHARRSASAPQNRPLVVACEQRPGYVTGLPDLPAAAREAEELAALFPNGTTLAGTAATTTNVVDQLAKHTWVHFACHGDPEAAGEAALLLADKPLTMTDLARLDLGHAHLAMLSACHTAMPDADLPDEAGHLAAALQIAGFRQVLSTLWAIGDGTAADVTVRLYRDLSTSGGALDPARAAAALRAVIRDLREQSPYQPSKWAPFVHFGH